MLLNLKKNKGFSIAETLTVVAIISIMSAIVISGYSNQKKNKAIQFSAQSLVSDIKLARNRSINISGFSGVDVREGYGVNISKFDSGGYKVFVDEGDRKYGAGDTVFKDADFEARYGIVVKNIISEGNNYNYLDITFEPPYGKVYMSFDGAPQIGSREVDITVGESCPQYCRTININSQGRISM